MDLTGITADDLGSVYRELAELVGLEATIAIFQSFRGTQISFPTKLLSQSAIRRIVREQSSVKSAKLLALELGYSERHIRQLISEVRAKTDT